MKRQQVNDNKDSRKKGRVSSTAARDSDDGMTVVQFYSKSKDIADLGCLGDGPIDSTLNEISNWRKVLSNFHPVQITVKNRIYPSVEHYFHAAKALCSNRPEYARDFEVGGRIGRLPPLEAKKAGGKGGFARAGATLNVAKWLQGRDKAVARALKSRVKVDPLFCRILLATRERKLYLLHFERGGSKSYWGGSVSKETGERVGRNRLGELLMVLRERLAKEQQQGVNENAEAVEDSSELKVVL